MGQPFAMNVLGGHVRKLHAVVAGDFIAETEAHGQSGPLTSKQLPPVASVEELLAQLAEPPEDVLLVGLTSRKLLGARRRRRDALVGVTGRPQNGFNAHSPEHPDGQRVRVAYLVVMVAALLYGVPHLLRAPVRQELQDGVSAHLMEEVVDPAVIKAGLLIRLQVVLLYPVASVPELLHDSSRVSTSGHQTELVHGVVVEYLPARHALTESLNWQ